MTKYISLGTPCGKLDASGQYYTLYRGNLYGMPSICYSLWNSFRCGDYFETISAAYAADEKEKAELANGYEDLKRLNLIIQLQDAIHYLPMRQGIGLGWIQEKDNYMVQCPSTDVCIPFLCYFIWCYADGKTSLMQIRQNLRKQGFDISDEAFVNAFYQILETEALTLV